MLLCQIYGDLVSVFPVQKQTENKSYNLGGFLVDYPKILAAGAMLYVVVEELIPEMSQGQHSNVGTMFFAVGFSVMMVLDVALG